jgi:hypothetical protein
VNLATLLASWKDSGAAERANYQLFLTQLCDLLDVPQPEPTRPAIEDNAYVFERDVTFHESDGTSSIGRIDLYKRGCFVLEAKQGSDAHHADEQAELLLLPRRSGLALTEADSSGAIVGVSSSAVSRRSRKKKGTAIRGTKAWDDAMIRARGQADRYARALPGSEGWPPFLIVVDVGHSIELYAERGAGKQPWPKTRAERTKAVQAALASATAALAPEELAKQFTRGNAEQIAEILDALASLGLVRKARGGKYAALG